MTVRVIHVGRILWRLPSPTFTQSKAKCTVRSDCSVQPGPGGSEQLQTTGSTASPGHWAHAQLLWPWTTFFLYPNLVGISFPATCVHCLWYFHHALLRKDLTLSSLISYSFSFPRLNKPHVLSFHTNVGAPVSSPIYHSQLITFIHFFWFWSTNRHLYASEKTSNK